MQVRPSFSLPLHLLMLPRTDIVLFSVDRNSVVTYFEGSSLVSGPALGATKDQNLVGRHLHTVWPDDKLDAAVHKIFNPDRVSQSYSIERDEES